MLKSVSQILPNINDISRGCILSFKPIDEMSLRHLFSSRLGEETLLMSYLGPILGPAGMPEENPDCLILDRREKTWKILRCEFKFAPCSKQEFAHNGQFDIAIVWKIRTPSNKQQLLDELKVQNGCQEIIVMSDVSNFLNLEDYHIPTEAEYCGIDKLQGVILGIKINPYPTAFAAYIAASIYPESFKIQKMVSMLANRFPEVKRMQPKGRSNVVSKLLQTKPPLIEFLYSGVYRWNNAIINANKAVRVLDELIRTRFNREVPDAEVVKSFLV